MIFVAAVLFFVAIVLAVAARRPSEFRVTRSLVMAAPPEKIFPEVNELRRWHPWSPWAKLDPDAQVVFNEIPAGTGASMAWSGNNKMGVGRMTVVASEAPSRVAFRLDFEKPFKGTNLAEFAFQPTNAGTEVRWTMTGTSPFVMKVVGLFLNCDKLCGDQFEKGLAQLKAVVEG
ncbi:Polyketide cyclase / dehydrase and lipid transport [Verrucomicrobium sp. GAS474]|uniref:SRPBCC family protein n=1 Tax=Verrucomicrobium sp. GAS474 TaxID=1882831 RepID=UPI00087B4475|nr:SRPBCC family protein [Verrucomicrobium sp. GAS474]SDT99333.1 Polyketide cyclase / dehydrase and lipid transport [Verrucomicrobium sp. GAS474]